MAEVKLEIPFTEIHGAIERQGIINRQKKYRDDKGRVIFEGKQEAYSVRNPRNYEKNPPKGAELQHINLFTEAVNRTKAILQDSDQRAVWQERFNKQLPNTRGKRPDPDAPIDPKTKRQKRYIPHL